MLKRVPLACVIVDDNQAFLDAARVLLQREGVDVLGIASNTAEARSVLEGVEPDVVLVDVVLGEESGFDLSRELTQKGSTVVLISTHAKSDIEDMLDGSGAAGFVSKSELSASTIRRILDREPGPSPS